MITLPVNNLAAATLCAAGAKDERYYLQGVLVERTASGETYIVATNGSLLFASTCPALECNQVGPWRIIIPTASVKLAVKGKTDLVPLPDGRYMLGDVVFTPIGGVFPDWRRVFPTRDKANISTERTQFNPHLLSLAGEALDVYASRKRDLRGVHQLTDTGPGLAVMHTPYDELAGVCIMGMRINCETQWFTPRD